MFTTRILQHNKLKTLIIFLKKNYGYRDVGYGEKAYECSAKLEFLLRQDPTHYDKPFLKPVLRTAPILAEYAFSMCGGF